MQSNILAQLSETAKYIQAIYPHKPEAAIVLGSGLGNLVAEMEVEEEIPYEEIPHFPVTTVKGHHGKLIFGRLNRRRIVAMSGRFHYYEGYAVNQVVFPIRAIHQLGVKSLILSNAAGGMNADFKVGDLMIITDHISFFTVNPLIGPNEDELGPRFPDMSEPYNKEIIQKVKKIAVKLGLELKEGVYAAVTGPTFETRAEYRLLHLAGAAAVGMSTVQEAIAAVHLGMKVFAMSVITDIGIREEENTITHEEVLKAAHDAEPKLTAIFKELMDEL